jgi:hypothetical protein
MINAPDRIEELRGQAAVTGIDYIFVHANQRTLDIHFLRSPATLTNPLFVDLAEDQVQIYNAQGVVPPIPVTQITWINGNETAQLTVAHPGDFTLYRLRINDNRIDTYYNDLSFSFKATCPSNQDCEPPAHECPPEDWVDFPVDYEARDFWSYRRALLEFASLRYPDWKDRLPADAGVMLAELMSAVGDEMAYYQDRVGREAYLETATQIRSLRRHTRLVDYTISDTKGAFVWMDITVKNGQSGNLPAGTHLWSTSENGTRTDYEIGRGLKESLDGEVYFVNSAINNLEAYRWDEDQVCLPLHTTELYLDGHHAVNLTLNQPLNKWVLLQTTPANPAQPARNHMVQLTHIEDRTDTVLNKPITYIRWSSDRATPFELDLTQLHVHGNMVPATAGKTDSLYLVVGALLEELDQPAQTHLQNLAVFHNRPVYSTIERQGANNSIAFLHTMPFTISSNLVWLPNEKKETLPEVNLSIMEYHDPLWTTAGNWTWKRSLIGVNSSEPLSEDYTLDDGAWQKVVTYQNNGVTIPHYDYTASTGATIRFGDGEFGLEPARQTVFLVHYRYGAGKAGNLAPGTIANFNATPALSFIETVNNPLPATGGLDAETPDEIRQSAPHAFREITYRAVTTPDYAEAAERLPWVQNAGAALRWTGSWLTVFVTPDPLNAVQMTDAWRNDLENQLNRFRQAGRETHTLEPEYADIDMEIELCIAAGSFAAEVAERVREALFGKGSIVRQPGYFAANRFTFGTPLERSTLEGVIQQVPGVKAVEWIKFRRRGVFDWKPFTEFFYDPGMNTIIRIENDPLHPERGTLKLSTHGGL